MPIEIPPNCWPVIGTQTFNGKEIYKQDYLNPKPLTLIDPIKGTVFCSLFKNGRCQGKMPCIRKEVYPKTTMVGTE